jgi:hypothetical protein
MRRLICAVVAQKKMRQKHLALFGWFILYNALCSSCMSARSMTAPTQSPAPPSPTATFIFPSPIPTSTFTPEPKLTKTPDVLNALGEILYREDFEGATDWQFRESQVGGASILEGRLSLAVRREKAFFFLRSPAPDLSDFYLEVVVRSELCSNGDEYGVMFRSNDLEEHYRFTLTCDGNAKVSRILQSGEVALVAPTQTYAVVPGMMIDNRMGILAYQNAFRFYINDQEVFTARDNALKIGGVSFFAHSRSDGQTTVSFDNIEVRAITIPPPTPEFPTPSP